MAEAKTTEKGGAARVRTAGEGTPGGSPTRANPRPGGRPQPRGKASPTGPTARLLAPLALIVCAIAVFSVLSGGDSNAPTRGASDSQKATQSNGSSDSSGDQSSGGATQPVRATYRVKPGDSFAAIAVKTGVDADKLAELNPDVDPRALQPGQKLKLK